MKKYVVISSNSNHDYLFYIPLVVYCWNKLGWNVLIIAPSESYTKHKLVFDNCKGQFLTYQLPEILGYSSETIAQCSRLYIANSLQDDVYVMVSDCDMIPLSNYWKPFNDEIVGYGRDLSNEHFPMCYISAPVYKWKEIMNLTGDTIADMKRDLDNEKEIKWTTDQDIVTERLSHAKVKRADRGIAPNSHFPLGRVDRGAWNLTLEQPARIDAHLPRPGYSEDNFSKIISVMVESFGTTKNEIDWLNNYRKEYIQLL